jgi:oligopeptide transport system ATP-binding protein
MRSPLLSVHNLSLSFKNSHSPVKALRNLSFDIEEQSCVGIVGESGCGKSALAKSLLQLFPEDKIEISGQVIFNDTNLLKNSEKEWRKFRGKEIGMVFQDPLSSLNPTLKIGYQIAEAYLTHFPKASNKEAWHEAEELLRLVGIRDPISRLNDYPHTLSGGMRQRVMIALALAGQPKLLIADEPTTALDVTLQAQILDLLKNLQKQFNMGIIFITHDLSLVAGFCDKVLVMYAGEIVEQAPVDTLFRSPAHPYTQRLLLSRPRLDQDQKQPLAIIEGSPPDLSQEITGCSFCPRCNDALKICPRISPPLFELPHHQSSRCWLYDPRYREEN